MDCIGSCFKHEKANLTCVPKSCPLTISSSGIPQEAMEAITIYASLMKRLRHKVDHYCATGMSLLLTDTKIATKI